MSRSDRGRARGFTLVELLVVIGIIGLLVTFLIGALWPQKEKAMRTKTGALLKAIQTALDQYYSEFRDYPPDGYDNEPGWQYPSTGGAKGVLLPTVNGKARFCGTGCLIYFLCYPITNFSTIGADQGVVDPRNTRATTVGPFLSTLKNEDITAFYTNMGTKPFDLAISPANPAYETVWSESEIVDAFGYPLHYDKVKDSSDPQFATYFQAGTFATADCHSDKDYLTQRVYAIAGQGGVSGNQIEDTICPMTTHYPKHSDPRGKSDPGDGCYLDNNSPQPRNPNGYDLWAHGKSFWNGRTAITNWNLAN